MTRHLIHRELGDYIIQGGRVKRPAKPRASLAALQWAAERANMSYGQFTQGLATDDEAQIQEEYEVWKAERSASRSCVEIKDEMSTGGLIITDDDI